MNEEINRCYDELAMAIVISAAEEYKRSRFILETINLRKYKDDDGRYKAVILAKRELESVELFFKSDWFYELVKLDGTKAFKALQETYVNEYYPARMGDIRNGRIWFVSDNL